MAERIYLRPLGLVPGPQADAALQLGGGMVYANRIAVILVENGVVTRRQLCTPDDIPGAIGALPDRVGREAEAQWANLRKQHPPLPLGDRQIRFDFPNIMGILNVTPDSFSDGGKFLDNPDEGRAHAAAMLEAGAAIIDIGGESTRPGAVGVWEGDELNRVAPAAEYCAAMGAAISVDTRRTSVMEAALDAGAHIINDISALQHDPRSLDLVAQRKCPVILMHTPSAGENPHADGQYDNIVFDVFDALGARRDAVIAGGVDRANIVLDPGIGFGKSLADNLALINALPLFHALGQPLMLGASRKQMIGALSHEVGVEDRLGGSLALALAGMNAGVHLLRVHDVADTVQARNVWRGLRDSALTDFSDLPS